MKDDLIKYRTIVEYYEKWIDRTQYTVVDAEGKQHIVSEIRQSRDGDMDFVVDGRDASISDIFMCDSSYGDDYWFEEVQGDLSPGGIRAAIAALEYMQYGGRPPASPEVGNHGCKVTAVKKAKPIPKL